MARDQANIFSRCLRGFAPATRFSSPGLSFCTRRPFEIKNRRACSISSFNSFLLFSIAISNSFPPLEQTRLGSVVKDLSLQGYDKEAVFPFSGALNPVAGRQTSGGCRWRDGSPHRRCLRYRLRDEKLEKWNGRGRRRRWFFNEELWVMAGLETVEWGRSVRF